MVWWGEEFKLPCGWGFSGGFLFALFECGPKFHSGYVKFYSLASFDFCVFVFRSDLLGFYDVAIVFLNLGMAMFSSFFVRPVFF